MSGFLDNKSTYVRILDTSGSSIVSTGGSVNVSFDTGSTMQVQSNSENLATEATASAIKTAVEGTLNVQANHTYVEDTAHVTGARGSLVLGVRSDVPSSLVDADGDYTPLQVDDMGYLRVTQLPISEVSTTNSTTTPLLAGAKFTGTFVEVFNYADLALTIKASHDSATDGLLIEHSTDGVNVDSIDKYTIITDSGDSQYSFGISSQYIRVSYTNGSVDQTFFRLQTLFKRIRGKASSHRVDEPITLQNDAELVRAVIMGETTAGGGGTINVKVNPSGTLQVNAEQDTATALQSLSHGSDDGGISSIPLLVDASGSLVVESTSLATEATVNSIKTAVEGTLNVAQTGVTNLISLHHASANSSATYVIESAVTLYGIYLSLGEGSSHSCFALYDNNSTVPISDNNATKIVFPIKGVNVHYIKLPGPISFVNGVGIRAVVGNVPTGGSSMNSANGITLFYVT